MREHFKELRFWLFVGISLLLFFASFVKGLYFNEDFYPIQLLLYGSSFFLVVYLFFKKELKAVYYPLIFFILPTILVFSLINAATPLGAWQAILKWTAYGCFFLLVYYVTRDARYKFLLSKVILFTGFCISLYSIAVYGGLLEFTGAISSGRLGGVYQYPNTFGVIMAALWLLALLHISASSITRKFAVLISISLMPFILGLFLSGSRGVWVLLPLIWIIGLFLLRLPQQLMYIIASTVSAGMSILIFLVASEQESSILTYLLLSMVLMMFVIYFFYQLLQKLIETPFYKKMESTKFVRLVAPSVLFTLSILFLLDLRFQGLIYSVLPSQFTERIQFGFDTFQERLIIANDAIQASKDSLIQGYGGNGWSVIYTNHQSLPYLTKSLHNGYLEWLISSGVPGLIAFIAIIVYFLLVIWKGLAKNEANLSVLLPLLLIFLHSLIDFNLSYGAVWFLVLSFIALGLPDSQIVQGKKQWKLNAFYVLATLLILVTAVQSYRFIKSDQLFDQAIAEESLPRKQMLVDESLQYNNYDIEKWNTLGLLLSEDESGANRENVRRIADKIYSLEKTNSHGLLLSIQLLFKNGYLEEALKLSEYAIEADPFDKNHLDLNLKLYTEISLKLIEQKQSATATEVAKKAGRNYEKFQRDFESIKNRLPNEDFNSREFQLTDEFKYYGSLSYFIAKDYENAFSISTELSRSQHETVREKSQALATVLMSNSLVKPDDQNETKLNSEIESHIQVFEQLLTLSAE
ncbi:O-antigen ligase family protein [Bacillus sp. ISL-55]|uniref:O-antigen ligase family protein n=1 Tax=Bacillus sp. ISL-55 TaxID=2819134 RepID=UPI001BED067C|nr:O-antigen ligase family protein [Bacillus sp. ISL-55]MBT2693711.1 O-antigen ligase family protein [Bacillus sp. ISL-55]